MTELYKSILKQNFTNNNNNNNNDAINNLLLADKLDKINNLSNFNYSEIIDAEINSFSEHSEISETLTYDSNENNTIDSTDTTNLGFYNKIYTVFNYINSSFKNLGIMSIYYFKFIQMSIINFFQT